jgi:tripartite-type tricarboxylate transporter receptor subunit TctC
MFKKIIGIVLSVLALSSLAVEMPPELKGKAIKYIVPTSPGSLSDVRSREVLDLVSKETGLVFVINYKPGNKNGNGMTAVAESAPDGLTIGWSTSPTRIIYDIKGAVGFPKHENFVPFVNLWRYSNVVSADVNAPFTTMKDAIAYVRANPNKLNYAQINAESAITLERLFNYETKDAVVGIPMTIHTEAIALMKNNQMTFLVTSLGTAKDNSAHIRMLATTGKSRSASNPDLPTLSEFIPGFEMPSYGTVFAPKGVPEHILKYLNEVFVNALRNPALIAKFKNYDYDLCQDDLQQTRAVYETEYKRFDRMLKEAKIEVK